MRKYPFWLNAAVILCLGVGSPGQTQTVPLDLNTYLQQVRKGHDGFAGSILLEESAELRREEAELLTEPALIANVLHIDDERETGSALQGTGTKGQNYSLGVRQTTDFGLDARLLYNFNRTALEGVNTTFFPEPEYYTSGPVLELTQPLWRNGFGREIRARKTLLDAQIKEQKFNESFQQKEILADAEAAYWRLALAREAVTATRETVDSAKRLRAWSTRRTDLNLGNRSDALQAEAAYLARSLDLKVALDEEKTAARAFNTLRGMSSESVPEQLLPFNGAFLAALNVPERKGVRDDVLAAEQQMRQDEANGRLGVEKSRPELNLVGTFGLNGRDVSASDTLSESIGGEHPNYTIGLRLDMPFDLGALSDQREGYRKEAAAAQLTYQRKVFEEQREWENQVALFREAREQLELTLTMEKAQREKLNYERSRHNRGLSTTFQVLQFEQDFASAQLARIRAQGNILNIHAELKTFGGQQ